ncbi:unnamed protein product [Closterium sp. Naga37s-1]|nr:unnamed protein product [Closterium sp. Naga37s-1]
MSSYCLTASFPSCLPASRLSLCPLPIVTAIGHAGTDRESTEAVCVLFCLSQPPFIRLPTSLSPYIPASLSPCPTPCQVWEPYAVKVRTVKTAIEAACMLLRIDDVVSGLKKKQAGGAPGGGKPQLDTGDDVDSEQMLAE